MADEPVPIGVRDPLSDRQTMLIFFSGLSIAIIALGCVGDAIANLAAGDLVAAGAAALVAVAFAGLLARFLNDNIPQRARLQGSVLAVERGGRERECDLARAEILKLGRTISLTPDYFAVVPILRARQQKGSQLVRFVLRGDGLRIVSSEQLLLLAEAIESGPAGRAGARRVCDRLRSLAEHHKPLPALDWSFRTDPEGTRTADE